MAAQAGIAKRAVAHVGAGVMERHDLAVVGRSLDTLEARPLVAREAF